MGVMLSELRRMKVEWAHVFADYEAALTPFMGLCVGIKRVEQGGVIESSFCDGKLATFIKIYVGSVT